MSLRQKIDSFNMTKNLTSQRKEAEKSSDVNVQFTSLDVKLVLKREINTQNIINHIYLLVLADIKYMYNFLVFL